VQMSSCELAVVGGWGGGLGNIIGCTLEGGILPVVKE